MTNLTTVGYTNSSNSYMSCHLEIINSFTF